MCSVILQPKAHAGDVGSLAQHDGQQHTHFTTNQRKRNRPAVVILGPLVATACKLRLWALALDLVSLRHSRAFGGNEGATDG